MAELWNALDESANWDRDSEQEDFHTLAWTYELRRTDSHVSPYWRKWPLLLVAGHGREIKVLDGYSGTLVKVLQGHGGVSPQWSSLASSAYIDPPRCGSSHH